MAGLRDAKWWLSGASGLVGGHLRSALSGRDVLATTHRALVSGATGVDLTDPEAVDRIVRDARPDIIIVAAAAAFVERCEREPGPTRALNVDAVRTVTEAAPRALIVVFSSEYVFGGTAGPYGEDDPVSPINEYGRQKVALEAIARERPAHLICRTSGVYGWSRARTSFVAQLVDRLRAGERFRVPSDQVITPTPAPDLARAVVGLVERGARGTFHVAGPEVLARPEFAYRAARTFELDVDLLDPVPTSELGLAAPRPRAAGLRTDKLRAVLGHALATAEVGLGAMRAAEPRE